MISLEVCVVLFALFVSTQSVGFRGFTYDGLKEPEVHGSHARSPIEKWIQQPVDHFNPRDNRTWPMRYYENDKFFNRTGPMLIMLGGEWAIAPGFVQTGQMYEIARAHGAIMYYTEHRYYGKSQPVDDTKPENLQYLSADQALADVGYFIETKKKETPGLSNSSVIVFGGSYAGNMAAWARVKYPHLIQGAVASSAPVRAKADFFEYYEVVASSLARYSKQCTIDVKDAFDTVEIVLGLTDGPEKLKEIFNLCEVPNTSSSSSLGYLMNALAEQFAGTVQYNNIGVNGTSGTSQLCDKMMDTSVETPVLRLGKLLSNSGECVNVNYEKFVEIYKNTSWESPARIMRLWYYQTCTEYGYYQTTNSKKSIFGSLFPLNFFVQICTDLYGKYYGPSLLDSSVRRTNLMYGGSLPDVKNVIFTNGNVDPWHALSVLEDLDVYSPAILIDGSSHCQDLYDDRLTDVASLKEARKRVRSIVNGWLA